MNTTTDLLIFIEGSQQKSKRIPDVVFVPQVGEYITFEDEEVEINGDRKKRSSLLLVVHRELQIEKRITPADVFYMHTIHLTCRKMA